MHHSRLRADEVQFLSAKNREEAILAVKAAAETGPYTGFIILMGTMPFEPFNEEFFAPLLPHLRIVVSASAGYDEFDVDWMTANGIYFCNTLNAVSEPTADIAIFLTLATIRDTTGAETSMRAGNWRVGHTMSLDPAGMRMGIIGLGSIGKLLAKKATAFNITAQYYNRSRLSLQEEEALDVTYCKTIDDLLASSDIISINCPLNKNTENLISTREFAIMKDGVIIINTARGAIINEDALIGAIESGKVWRAGLDVFKNEPNANPWFLKSDKCVVLPHIGGLSVRASRDAEAECFANLMSFVATGKPVAPVNRL